MGGGFLERRRKETGESTLRSVVLIECYSKALGLGFGSAQKLAGFCFDRGEQVSEVDADVLRLVGFKHSLCGPCWVSSLGRRGGELVDQSLPSNW